MPSFILRKSTLTLICTISLRARAAFLGGSPWRPKVGPRVGAPCKVPAPTVAIQLDAGGYARTSI